MPKHWHTWVWVLCYSTNQLLGSEKHSAWHQTFFLIYEDGRCGQKRFHLPYSSHYRLDYRNHFVSGPQIQPVIAPLSHFTSPVSLDRCLLQVVHWVGMSTSYNPASKEAHSRFNWSLCDTQDEGWPENWPQFTLPQMYIIQLADVTLRNFTLCK